MRILCVLGKFQYGRPELGEGIEYTAFISALRRLGHEVVHFESWDRGAYTDFAELNRELLNAVAIQKPDVLFAVQRDCEIWTETLDAIRQLGSTIAISWTTDDSWKYKKVSRFIGHHYDVMCTTYDYVVPLYKRDGMQNVFLTQWAANAEWLREPLPARECRYAVSFVGAAYGRRRRIVSELKSKGIRVDCFGQGWARGPVSAEQIPKIMRESCISLNFAAGFQTMGASKSQIKARTFEVPGAGGLLLTDCAPGLENCYAIGSEILTYGNLNEMVEQVRRMERNPDLRDQIAMAGYVRTKRDHTYDRRLSEMLNFAHARQPGKHIDRDLNLSDAHLRHAVSPQLTRARDILLSACGLVWGAERGARAARRAAFELSWRVTGARTFTASGLPGRLFPKL